MTPRQFSARLRGIRERERLYFEGLRIASYLIAGPNLKKGIAVEKFWPLPWDKKIKIQVQTAEQLQMFENSAKLFAQKLRSERGND